MYVYVINKRWVPGYKYVLLHDDPSDLLKTCKQSIFGCICNFTSRYGRDSKVSSSFYNSLSTKAGWYQRFGNVAISAFVHSLFKNLKVTEITAERSVKKLVSYGSEVSAIIYSAYPRVGHWASMFWLVDMWSIGTSYWDGLVVTRSVRCYWFWICWLVRALSWWHENDLRTNMEA